MSNRPLHSPLLAHHFRGPWLEWFGFVPRIEALEKYCDQLESDLGRSHPHSQLARSWLSVSYGAEHFDAGQLDVLREAESSIRTHFPSAHEALALNVAAQGCHTWFLHTRAASVPLLADALQIMITHDVCCDADVIKVGELLAASQAACGQVESAFRTIHRVLPRLAAATKQSPSITSMFVELCEQLIDEMGADAQPKPGSAAEAVMFQRASMHLILDER
ncbi:hypothetical protein [Roseateles toxinivorans]|uniref:hypothetical protein n=1 Tax=Roseateles toxinivorans TaxID=270368 RepID=UPI00105FB143|nr:hypothetical protein [Roseateles toxinivorans]